MTGIVKMLMSDLLFPVIISNIIAAPVSYFLINSFLNWGWTTRMNIGVGMFLFAAAVTFLTAIVSILYQTIKAAVTNPVDSLRYE